MKPFRFSNHALEEIERRQIPLTYVEAVLENPQQVVVERYGCSAYQSKVDFGTGGDIYILRVIVDDKKDPAMVITAYRTSKISKYWRTEQ